MKKKKKMLRGCFKSQIFMHFSFAVALHSLKFSDFLLRTHRSDDILAFEHFWSEWVQLILNIYVGSSTFSQIFWGKDNIKLVQITCDICENHDAVAYFPRHMMIYVTIAPIIFLMYQKCGVLVYYGILTYGCTIQSPFLLYAER